MKKYPSVSIIVPAYNVEAYVADGIKSVMRQTYRGEMDCIVVDNCWSDNSLVVVEKQVLEYDGPIRLKLRVGSICDKLPREGSIRAYETIIQEVIRFCGISWRSSRGCLPF